MLLLRLAGNGLFAVFTFYDGVLAVFTFRVQII